MIPMPQTGTDIPDGTYGAVVALAGKFLDPRAPGPAGAMPDARAVARAADLLGVVCQAKRGAEASCGQSGWSEAFLDAIEPAVRRHLACSIQVCEDAGNVLAALGAAGVPHIPFKGVFLSRDLYGDPLLRRSGDIDLLLKRGRQDLQAAYAALSGLGYSVENVPAAAREYMESEGTAVGLRRAGGTSVDVHCALYGDLVPDAATKAAARTRTVEADGTVRERFSGGDMLAILATHYLMTPGKFSLRWLVDCAALCLEPATFTREHLEHMQEMGAQFPVAVTICAVRKVFGLEPQAAVRLEPLLTRRQRKICEQVRNQGPENLKFGLVQKAQRLGMPLRRRIGKIRDFLWPRPGRVSLAMGLPGPPRLSQRMRYACGKLRQAIDT